MVFGGLNSHSGASVTGRFVSCESKKAGRSERGKKPSERRKGKGLPERHLFKASTHISLIASAGDVRQKGRHKSNESLSIGLHYFYFSALSLHCDFNQLSHKCV